MKRIWTAAVLAFALVAGHLVVVQPQATARDRRVHTAAFGDWTQHPAPLSKRADGARVDARVWNGRHAAAPPPASAGVAGPVAFAVVSTERVRIAHATRTILVTNARAPPSA